MTGNLEHELEIEVQEARLILENSRVPINDTKLKWAVLSNFHQYLPGHIFRIGIEKREGELDIPIREAERRFCERCGLDYTENDTSSEKYLSTSYRQYFKDIDDALRTASSEEVMRLLQELSERNHKLYDKRKDYSHPKPIELLGKTIDEQMDVLYKAYSILRGKGYFKADLTA